MTNSEFIIWIHGRLKNVHGENENFDYMHRLLKLADQLGEIKGEEDDTK